MLGPALKCQDLDMASLSVRKQFSLIISNLMQNLRKNQALKIHFLRSQCIPELYLLLAPELVFERFLRLPVLGCPQFGVFDSQSTKVAVVARFSTCSDHHPGNPCRSTGRSVVGQADVTHSSSRSVRTVRGSGSHRWIQQNGSARLSGLRTASYT